MNHDSSIPGDESAPGQHAVLSHYPIYVSAPPPRPERTYSPVVTSIGAYAVAFVAQLVAAFPLGLWVVSYGIDAITSSPGSGHQAAARAALVVIAVTSVVGVLAAWIFLRLRKVPSALLVAFLIQVADVVLAGLGGRLADGVGWVAGGFAAIGTAYGLITWRRMRDSNPRGR